MRPGAGGRAGAGAGLGRGRGRGRSKGQKQRQGSGGARGYADMVPQRGRSEGRRAAGRNLRAEASPGARSVGRGAGSVGKGGTASGRDRDRGLRRFKSAGGGAFVRYLGGSDGENEGEDEDDVSRLALGRGGMTRSRSRGAMRTRSGLGGGRARAGAEQEEEEDDAITPLAKELARGSAPRGGLKPSHAAALAAGRSVLRRAESTPAGLRGVDSPGRRRGGHPGPAGTSIGGGSGEAGSSSRQAPGSAGGGAAQVPRRQMLDTIRQLTDALQGAQQQRLGLGRGGGQ